MNIAFAQPLLACTPNGQPQRRTKRLDTKVNVGLIPRPRTLSLGRVLYVEWAAGLHETGL